MNDRLYTVSTWDTESQRWHMECTKITKWEIRVALRQLYSLGWDTCSILVETDIHYQRGQAFN